MDNVLANAFLSLQAVGSWLITSVEQMSEMASLALDIIIVANNSNL